MKSSVVIAFPSTRGYQFLPSDTGEKSDILAALKPADENWRDEILVTPFARASWVGHNRWLPKSKAIFIVGVTSRGIQNVVHRGSYSMWIAAKVVPRTIFDRSFTPGEVAVIMKELFHEFTEAVRSVDKYRAFFEAIEEYVVQPAGREKLKLAIDELSVRIVDPKIARYVSKWYPVRNRR